MEKKFLKSLLASRWAIRSDEAVQLASSGFGEELFKKDGEVDHRNFVTIRNDGIAVIHVDGALSYRSNIFSAWMGFDTYNSIEAAFDDAMKNPFVLGIIFDIDSPGGQVSGCADLSDKIFNARGKKPCGIVARTGGLMCSAAYWIGSSCEKVFCASNATIGSIGTMSAFSKSGKSMDIVVSDLSPNKNAPVDTEEGMALLKQELNDLASVFIDAVARNRGTTYEDVLENYGKGGCFIGQKAVYSNLVDGILSMEEICEKMKKCEIVNFTNQTEGANMATKETEVKGAEASAPSAEEIGKNAVAAYKQNIADVKALFAGCGIDEDAVAFVDSGKTLAEAKEFAFDAMKEKVAKQDEEIKSVKAELETAKKELESSPKADANANLSEEQKLAVQKGLEAEAAASNSVQGGHSAAEASIEKVFAEAFARGAKGK